MRRFGSLALKVCGVLFLLWMGLIAVAGIVVWVGSPSGNTSQIAATTPAVAAPPGQTSKWKARPSDFPSTMSTDGLDVVDDVIDEILRKCPRLNEMVGYSSGITYSWRVESPAGNYISRTWGWDIQLEIGVVLGGSYPIPPELDGLGAAFDHVLFVVGVGQVPGIEIDKSTSQYACGKPVGPTRDTLIPDEWMRQLDRRFPSDLVRSRPPKMSTNTLQQLRRMSGDPLHPAVFVPPDVTARQ